MMKRRKMVLSAILTLLCFFLAVGFSACKKKDAGTDDSENTEGVRDYTDTVYKTYVPVLTTSSDKVEIGVDGVQKWVFRKDGENWLFDGVYAISSGKDERVFVGSSGKLNENGTIREDGYYFTVLSTDNEKGLDKSVNGMVTDISVVANEKDAKSVLLKGKGFESVLKVTSFSQFVERSISIKPQYDADIETGDVSFVLRGKVDEYTEYGYILSRKASDEQYSLPYSFPALAGKLTRQSDQSKVYTYINVVDYYNTAACFKTARRRIGLNYFFEEGILSSSGYVYAEKNNDFIESVLVRTGNNDSFYDLIYDARYEYGRINDLDVAALVTANGNMNVYDWDEAVYGATYDIEDSRGRPLGDDLGTWGPYGYNNSGAESFGAMNILKGLVRYAKATADQELYDFSMKYLLQMVTPDPVYNKCYVMPLNSEAAYSQFHSDYFFFLSCFGSTYTAVDSYMGAGSMNFGAFKYYSRVSELGELALITGNEQLKSAYLKLMVMVKRLHMENFEQPVEWGHDGTPKLDYENGGSSGAEAMWADCMYIASLLTENSTEKAQYLDYMKKATDLANKQGFERSSSLRNEPKPETSGYLARMNLILYESTGDKQYLNYALTAANGIYFFYYHNSNPYTYFQTLGYGYACAHERWEAFMEMVESLELLVPIFKYTDDPLLYELYFTLRESALSALPVNGYPEGVLGGHSDWLDALYVPFEQPTAVLGDNGLDDGGASSYRRWSKEQYGMGELYLGALMYSTHGKAADPKVLVLNYTSTWLNCSRTSNSYKIYNYGESGKKAISFANYDSGSYRLIKDGKSVGIYTAEQLANGVALDLEGNKAASVVVELADGINVKAIDKKTTVIVKNVESDSATVEISAEGASHYRLYVSTQEDFGAYNTSVKFSENNLFELGFEDAAALYLKAVAYDVDGNAYIAGTASLFSPDVQIGVQEDYEYERVANGESIPLWTATSEYYKGAISLGVDLNDFVNYPEDSSKYRQPTGYMALYKPVYIGYDTDTFTRTFTVDLGEYPLFDFYPFTKNFKSLFSLKATINGKTFVLIDKAAGFDKPNYRFDLAEISGVSGVEDVTIIMVSEGFNRGFAIKKMRFVKETETGRIYDLTKISYASEDAEVIVENGTLTIQNGSYFSGGSRITLPVFDPSGYTEMEILIRGMTDQQNGFIRAAFIIYDGETEIYTKNIGSISAGNCVILPIAEMNLAADKNYVVEMIFTRGTTLVNNIVVDTIRLKSDTLSTDTEGFDESKGFVPVVDRVDGKYQIINGWESNWAFANSDDGTIANMNPNQGYGSIYKSNIMVDLDETPIIRFTVSNNKGNVTWALKINDGSLVEDLLLKQSSETGTFEANMRDVFKRSGVVYIRLDFYVINARVEDGSLGVFFDGYAFIKGTTLYGSLLESEKSVTVSEKFTVNTAITDYIVLDIPELTYGSKWLVYLVDENGAEYELKTIYESVYSKMYSRSKCGVFKYKISDIIPEELQGKDVLFTLKILVDTKNTVITFGKIRLVTDNDTLVLGRVCEIR
ncbi:MAG: hypothetical protein IJU84_09970 [Clostridia bacterium]|nr:hypothetical protein [Clostridia bacterium]